MKGIVQANELRNMLSALKRAAPKSLMHAVLLDLDDDRLLGKATGDSLYAEYEIEAQVEEGGIAIVGNQAFDGLAAYHGDVHLRLTDTGKTLFLTGTHEINFRTIDASLSLFGKPTFSPMFPEKWLPIPPQLSNIVYATGDKQMDQDIVWIERNKFLCGRQYTSAYAEWEHETDREVAVRSALVLRSIRGSDVKIALGERHVWFRCDGLTTAMPFVQRPIFPQYQVLMGHDGDSEVVSWFKVRTKDLSDAVKTLMPFAIGSASQYGTIRMTAEEDCLRLLCAGNELGSGIAEVSILEREGEFDWGISPVFLIGSLSQHDEKDAKIWHRRYWRQDIPKSDVIVLDGKGICHFISPQIIPNG